MKKAVYSKVVLLKHGLLLKSQRVTGVSVTHQEGQYDSWVFLYQSQ